jgi:hypothetical protein
MQGRATLDEIGRQFGTDKASGSHDYLNWYDPMLEPMRDQPIVFLEIGVGGGGSLKMWHEYFPHAFIFGMDIEPGRIECAKGLERGIVTIGDQACTEALDRAAPPVIHVVNDDGGHNPEHQVISYKHLLPKLVPGGLYLLEDIGHDEVAEFLTRLAKHCIRGTWSSDSDPWVQTYGPRIGSMGFFYETSATRIKRDIA